MYVRACVATFPITDSIASQKVSWLVGAIGRTRKAKQVKGSKRSIAANMNRQTFFFAPSPYKTLCRRS